MTDIKTLILGLGNPILGDDGVGWRVAERVAEQLREKGFSSAQVEIDYLAVGGLSLMERMVGYDRAILVDAIATNKQPIGTVNVFSLDQLPNRAQTHLSSSHDTTLHNALEVGRRMGAHLPEVITIVGVEAELVYDFSEELSPEVRNAVMEAATKIIELTVPSSI